MIHLQMNNFAIIRKTCAIDLLIYGIRCKLLMLPLSPGLLGRELLEYELSIHQMLLIEVCCGRINKEILAVYAIRRVNYLPTM